MCGKQQRRSEEKGPGAEIQAHGAAKIGLNWVGTAIGPESLPKKRYISSTSPVKW